MNVKNVFISIGNFFKDHASDIMMGAGTAGVVGGSIVLCRETLKLPDIIDDYKDAKEDLIANEAEKKEFLGLKLKTAGKIVLNYAPGALLEGAGLGSMWGGYSKTKTALVGIGAAYSGLQEAFDKYRGNVIEEYGEEVDQKMMYSIREEEIETRDDNGNIVKEKVKIYPHDSRKMPSMYARYFAYGEAEGAEQSITYNENFLNGQISALKARLRAYKRLMLNEVYECLGIRPSKAGNHVGWVYDPNCPSGDNQIDLRVQKVYRERLDPYGNPDGYEEVLMIDPNVDGMVEDKMLRMGLIDP